MISLCVKSKLEAMKSIKYAKIKTQNIAWVEEKSSES